MIERSPSPTSLFYQFSGIHSLLIGLLPFFLPVLLWQSSFSLSFVSGFIALNGVGYILTLYAWDRLRLRLGWKWIMVTSLVLEMVVVSAIVLDDSLSAVYWIALLNGAYSCFFWMSQRLLFIQSTDSSNSAYKFGNFQIIVAVLLKIGILTGGFLWDLWGSIGVFWVSLCFSIPAATYCLYAKIPEVLQRTMEPAIGAKAVLAYRDDHNSRLVFVADGLFLFAESYFWVITLYFVSGQSIASLALLVVGLSILLAGLFYLIKNRLDKANPQRIFVIAVFAYAVSWCLRGVLDSENDAMWDYPVILVIGFLTAFFRLAFNKRFFDLSRKSKTHQYIVIKSYYSQLGVALLFAFTAIVFADEQTLDKLPLFYWALVPISLVYLSYQKRFFDRKS